jgi:hypothetical protein
MIFLVYDWRRNKGYWMPDNKGYTDKAEEAGLYAPEELPTWAGDCWIAIPFPSRFDVVALLKRKVWQ